MRLKAQFRLGRIADIPVRVDWSWLIILVWMTWVAAQGYLAAPAAGTPPTLIWGMAFATALLFFATVLLHELGHALVARAQGANVQQVLLHVFGGVTQVDHEPLRPRHEALTSVIGPIVTLTIGGLFGVLYNLVGPRYPLVGAPVRFLQHVSIGLGLFNLLPGYPLDGGRVLRALLWAVSSDIGWATRWAARAGQAVAWVIISLGALLVFVGDGGYGIGLALVGLLLYNAARSAQEQSIVRQVLDGFVVADAMVRRRTLWSPEVTLDLLVVDDGVEERPLFWIGREEQVVGLLTDRGLQRVPRKKWAKTRASDVLLPLGDFEPVTADMPLELALRRMAVTDQAQLPVITRGVVVGAITRDGVIRFVQRRLSFGAT